MTERDQLTSRELPRVFYSFPHPLGGPGINHTAWEQVTNLSALGVPVTVYCTSLREPLTTAVRVTETMRVAGRRVPHRAVGIRNAYRYHDARAAAALRRMAGEIDVVHCWPSSCLRTMATARRLGVPTFREAPNEHTATGFAEAARAGMEVGVELPKGSSHRYDGRRLRVEEAEFALADFILAPSDYVANSFIALNIPRERVVRHQYGYDPGRFPAPSAPRAAARPFTAAFVGRVEPAKGLHLALRAWIDADCGEHGGRFLVLGRGFPEYERYLAELLAHPSVQRLGFVSDVGAILRTADVLVLPTYTEGSALVTLEAMASGVVPLVSKAAGAPIEDGVEGFLHDVGDVATLASQLRSLDADAELLASMRARSLLAAGAFTWRAAAQRLVEAYREGLARRRAA